MNPWVQMRSPSEVVQWDMRNGPRTEFWGTPMVSRNDPGGNSGK